MQTLRPEPTIVEKAYRAILDAICDGRLEPGRRLTQEEVARTLDVSRQPVGQALLLLKQQKFLREAGRRGLMVAPLDREFMRWIYELRLAIEPLAASLGARRATADEIARGRELIASGRRAVDAGSTSELIAADMEFHMLICELSGNRLFVDTMAQLWNHLRRSMREVLQHREYREGIWTEHDRVLDAIASGDAAKAEAITRAHLQRAMRNVGLPVPGAAD